VLVYGTLIGPFIKIHKVTEKHHEDASALAFEVFSSIRIVVAFGAEAKLAKQHELLLDKAAKNEKRAAPLMGLMMSPSMMAMFGTFGITFWFGIKQLTEGKIADIGVITVVLFSVMMAVMNIGRLAGPIIAIAKAATAAGELFVTIDAPSPDVTGLKEPEITADTDIKFENVAFSYPSRPNVQILHGVDLHFPAGKVTAIVGPSGSGKSTVVGLVQRWYELLGTTATHTAENPATNPKEVEAAESDAKNGKPKWHLQRQPKIPKRRKMRFLIWAQTLAPDLFVSVGLTSAT
jgi:ABC-type multidrug transport system fused ATPase/permease subunit